MAAAAYGAAANWQQTVGGPRRSLASVLLLTGAMGYAAATGRTTPTETAAPTTLAFAPLTDAERQAMAVCGLCQQPPARHLHTALTAQRPGGAARLAICAACAAAVRALPRIAGPAARFGWPSGTA